MPSKEAKLNAMIIRGIVTIKAVEQGKIKKYDTVEDILRGQKVL